MKLEHTDVRFYVVTTPPRRTDRTIVESLKIALSHGASMVQLRDKSTDSGRRNQLITEVKALCLQFGVPLLINDYVDLALRCAADGVHLGKSDMAIDRARQLLGADKIIGATVKSVNDALRAEQLGADYLGVGAAFNTDTKQDTELIDHDIIAAVCRAVDIPVLAIGGINAGNIGQLYGKGLAGVALASAIFDAEDIVETCQQLDAKTRKLNPNK